MVSTELIGALTDARRGVLHDVWQQLTSRIAAYSSCPDLSSIRTATADLINRDAAWLLEKAFTKSPNVTWGEIAASMATVDYLSNNQRLIELVWTGPSNTRLPVRRIDQIFYDLISKADRKVLLVTFAAYRIERLVQQLAKAISRGVSVTLIFESEAESEGQLTKDAAAAFQELPRSRVRIYYWPLAKRRRNPGGRPGKLHVKCAVIDDAALVGSANLTDAAFNRNMELGVLIRDNATVHAIEQHFDELIRQGWFVELINPQGEIASLG
jgi:phosphatidylserine/phosphatidylglycerophosphate/cardiolipin synthase-like enzyme